MISSRPSSLKTLRTIASENDTGKVFPTRVMQYSHLAAWSDVVNREMIIRKSLTTGADSWTLTDAGWSG